MLTITHRSKTKISRFYEETLKTKMKNIQWSWGAQNEVFNRVFLNVWVDLIDGKQAQVFWKKYQTRSNGSPERLRHLNAIRAGATAIGILCEVVDPNAKKRKIQTFDDEQLLVLGSLSEDEDHTYARILGRLPIEELEVNPLVADIQEAALNPNPTTAQALINARLGQGKFGAAVRAFWNNRCSVTGSSTKAALEASHILSWRESDNTQRLDSNNGLLLTANLHKLFDAGLITFGASGKMLISSKLSLSERSILGLMEKQLSKTPSSEMAIYLSHHRSKFLK